MLLNPGIQGNKDDFYPKLCYSSGKSDTLLTLIGKSANYPGMRSLFGQWGQVRPGGPTIRHKVA